MITYILVAVYSVLSLVLLFLIYQQAKAMQEMHRYMQSVFNLQQQYNEQTDKTLKQAYEHLRDLSVHDSRLLEVFDKQQNVTDASLRRLRTEVTALRNISFGSPANMDLQ